MNVIGVCGAKQLKNTVNGAETYDPVISTSVVGSPPAQLTVTPCARVTAVGGLAQPNGAPGGIQRDIEALYILSALPLLTVNACRPETCSRSRRFRCRLPSAAR